MNALRSAMLQRVLVATGLLGLLAATPAPAGILKVEVGVEGMF